MPGSKGRKAEKKKLERPQASDSGKVCWWNVKEKKTDERGQPFRKTKSDDYRRQGRADTLHAGTYLGYYPKNWYDDCGRVADPTPPTPTYFHDGIPKLPR